MPGPGQNLTFARASWTQAQHVSGPGFLIRASKPATILFLSIFSLIFIPHLPASEIVWTYFTECMSASDAEVCVGEAIENFESGII